MSSRFSRYRFVVAVMLALTTVGSARAGTLTTVYFDGDHQGGSGNYGELFTPFDDVGLLAALTVTARTAIAPLDPFDPYAAGLPGTIYLASSGAGVQDQAGNGSSQISGLKEDGIEELILTFNVPVPVDSLRLTLKRYQAGSGLDSYDDPLVFVSLTDGSMITFSELNGIVEGPDQTGTLDLGSLLDPMATVQSITVRELRRHVRLDSITFVNVPAPGSIVLLGLAGFLSRRTRRRAA